jgi:hypothetical protein
MHAHKLDDIEVLLLPNLPVQEVHGYYESKFAEIRASIEDCTLYAKLTSHLEELS